MTEVDDIEAALKDPVNSWFNSNQQLAFQRLLLIARVNKAAYETLRDASQVIEPLTEREKSYERDRAKRIMARDTGYQTSRGSSGAEPTPPIGRDHA